LIPANASTLIRTSTDITFTADALSRATVLGQIDFKFIAAVIPPSTVSPVGTGSTLVMIDQHAADERISVESLLTELCDGFLLDTIPITELQEPLPAVILGRQEAVELSAPGVADIFARWGIELAVPSVDGSEGGEGEGGYVQVPIRAVPTALKVRLGRKEASEMTRLVKLFLPVLADGLGQVQALIGRGQRETHEDKVDWGEVLRWMPKEMLELANSKACRSE
jgi:DNA mismatch repair protein MLH3